MDAKKYLLGIVIQGKWIPDDMKMIGIRCKISLI